MEVFVGVELVTQAAHKAAAQTRDLLRVKGKPLLFCHADGNRVELAAKPATAQLLAAMTDAADHTSLVAHADLLHVHAHAEARCQIAHQVAEIDAIFGLEEEHGLVAIEQELDGNGIHVRGFFCGELAEDRQRLAAFHLKLFSAGDVFVRCQATHGLERGFQLGHLIVGGLEHRLVDMAELKAASGEHDDGVIGDKIEIAGVEPQGFGIASKSNRRYANHTVPLSFRRTAHRCTFRRIHYSRGPNCSARLRRKRGSNALRPYGQRRPRFDRGRPR